MAGKKLTRSIGRKLTAYGEDEIFALYLQHGGVRPLLKNMPEKVGSVSTGVFYDWLKETPERASKWQMVQEIQGSNWAEEALEIADDADSDTVQVARLRSDTRKWLAERFNRPQFGKPELAATVGITIGDEFLESLKKVEDWAKAKRIVAKSEEVLEADYEVVEDENG
jgi:nitrogenase molybdenum-iron protein alpha/beta subunit